MQRKLVSLFLAVMMLANTLSLCFGMSTAAAASGCDHSFVAYSTGSYRYVWLSAEKHKYYEIFQEVCTKCGYAYRQSMAEIATYNHIVSSNYMLGGVHLTPGKHQFFKGCSKCGGQTTAYKIVSCPADNGYAHVGTPSPD